MRRPGFCTLMMLALLLLGFLLVLGCRGGCGVGRPKKRCEAPPPSLPVKLCGGQTLAAPVDDACDFVEISRVGNETRLVLWRVVDGEPTIVDERYQPPSWQIVPSRGGYDLVLDEVDWTNYTHAFRRVHCRDVLRTNGTLEDCQRDELLFPDYDRCGLVFPLRPGQAPIDVCRGCCF